MDVSAWLNGLGMGDHAPSFADNEIEAATLSELTAYDLKELGVVKLGQRKRLLAAIAALGQPEPPPPRTTGRAPPFPSRSARRSRPCRLPFRERLAMHKGKIYVAGAGSYVASWLRADMGGVGRNPTRPT